MKIHIPHFEGGMMRQTFFKEKNFFKKKKKNPQRRYSLMSLTRELEVAVSRR